jgi:hypothetical protein
LAGGLALAVAATRKNTAAGKPTERDFCITPKTQASDDSSTLHVVVAEKKRPAFSRESFFWLYRKNALWRLSFLGFRRRLDSDDWVAFDNVSPLCVENG